jgi:hypothetical protein
VDLKQIGIGNFTLTVPKDWKSEIEDGVLTITKMEGGEGAIQSSHYVLESDVPFSIFHEFHELVTDTLTIELDNDWAKKVKAIKDNFLILEIEDLKESGYFIYGLCENNKSILFLTYNCAFDAKDKEMSEVFKFFKEIKFN